MMLEAAPTPCRRTGFHISRSSLCDEAEWRAPAVVHAVATPAAGVEVGSIMIRSPGDAASIAAWTEAVGATSPGAFPPLVTVTVSMDSSLLADVPTQPAQLGAACPSCC